MLTTGQIKLNICMYKWTDLFIFLKAVLCRNSSVIGSKTQSLPSINRASNLPKKPAIIKKKVFKVFMIVSDAGAPKKQELLLLPLLPTLWSFTIPVQKQELHILTNLISNSGSIY